MVIFATTTIAADFSEADKAQFIKLHNDARAVVGVTARSSAAGWVGTPADAMKFWIGEKPYYNHGSNKCVGGVCGHYTQVVWSRSTQIGCARVTNCNINGRIHTLIAHCVSDICILEDLKSY
uniref:SCP domain-containing protein n=1 Tax=Leersia perrieri TaxID=77586 RepID=A0A0D9WV55_9ORYZ